MTESHPAASGFIATAPELEAAVATFARSPSLALDTEFERSRTYHAELCLVQIAAAGHISCIDPLALPSLGPLVALLRDYRGDLLLHAARQDLEVLHRVAGALPAGRLIDTQVAAALAGHADNIGYAELVRLLLGVEVDKSQTRTDWRQRPLSAAQLAYAADDVRHLDAVASCLLNRLAELGRSAWLDEDCLALMAPALYEPPAESAWQRIKGIQGLAPPAFARAFALAAWRETTARSRNLPRGWVLKDEELLHIAQAAPATVRELTAIAGSANASAWRRHGETIVELLHAAPSASLPPPPRRLTVQGRAFTKQLQNDALAVASELAIVPTVLITRREIEAAVSGDPAPRLLHGWRAAYVAPLLERIPADNDGGLWED